MTIIPITSFDAAANYAHLPTVAIDIGCSGRNRSTGYDDGVGGAKNLRFNEAIKATAEFFRDRESQVLILEAPLSGIFDEAGNHVARGDFERIPSPRGWYYGAGASTCLGALFFLRRLMQLLHRSKGKIHLLEGFVSRDDLVSHERVARALRQSFTSPNKSEWPTFDTDTDRISILSLLGFGKETELPAVIMPRSVS